MKLKKLLKILNYFGYNEKISVNHNINTFHKDSLEILSKYIKINLLNKIKLKYENLDLKKFIIFELKSPTKTDLIINIDDIIYIYPIQQPRQFYCIKLVLINRDLKSNNKGYIFNNCYKNKIDGEFKSMFLHIIYKKKTYSLYKLYGYLMSLYENKNLDYKSIEYKKVHILMQVFHPYLKRLIYDDIYYKTIDEWFMKEFSDWRIIMLFI